MSIELVKGLVPYRDIFLHKTPLAAFFGALGAWLAPLLSTLSPVNGAHLAYLLLGSAAPALLYLVCREVLPVLAAVAAAAFMMAHDQWLVASLEGVRPKVATVTLGLASLLSASRRRYLLSGVLGGMATLCWQPGLSFLAASAAQACVDRRRHREPLVPALTRMTVGSLFPVIVLLAWFAYVGALRDFFEQAVGFNINYIRSKAVTGRRTAAALLEVFTRWNRVEMLLMVPALVGMGFSRRIPPVGIVTAGLIYLAMTFASFQAWPDSILFAPFFAALLATGLTSPFSAFPRTAAAFVSALALFCALAPHSARLDPPMTFDDQGRFFKKITSPLGDEDGVVAISTPEALIHLQRRSAWRWPYMWSGVDRFAARRIKGGFEGLFGELESIDPTMIIISRRWGGKGRAAFNKWAASRYDRKDYRFYPTRAPTVVHRRIGR